MGGGSYSSTKYCSTVDSLAADDKLFSRASTARSTGRFDDIAEILDPKKLKDGMRESCYVDGFDDATPIVIGIDATGSMHQVPGHIQTELPKLIDLIVEKEVSDHPNVMFIAFDDETVMKNAAFQMSQFEIEAEKLVEALNEMIIPYRGGGNMGESYHLFFYALANHTKLECFDTNDEKGFAFLICDEEPYFDRRDYTKYGTSPDIAESVFGDVLQAEVPMLDAVKQTLERYHVFIIRPLHTNHGSNHDITKQWQDLLMQAGGNPEHVFEVPETDAIITTMVMAVSRLIGVDESEMVELLRAKGAAGIENAASATGSLVPVEAGSVSTDIETGSSEGRERL